MNGDRKPNPEDKDEDDDVIQEKDIHLDIEKIDHSKTQNAKIMAPLPLVKKGSKSKEYKVASKQLLHGIVPREESAKTSCLFMMCCCCYYGFCCCLCCEKSKSVTKQTFEKRFVRWLHLDGQVGRD